MNASPDIKETLIANKMRRWYRICRQPFLDRKCSQSRARKNLRFLCRKYPDIRKTDRAPRTRGNRVRRSDALGRPHFLVGYGFRGGNLGSGVAHSRNLHEKSRNQNLLSKERLGEIQCVLRTDPPISPSRGRFSRFGFREGLRGRIRGARVQLRDAFHYACRSREAFMSAILVPPPNSVKLPVRLGIGCEELIECPYGSLGGIDRRNGTAN